MTGIRVRAVWGIESEFGTAPENAEIQRVFGPGTRLSVERNNNSKFLTNLGSYHVSHGVPGQYDGRGNLTFYLTLDHIEWLNLAVGKWTTSGSGPYEHTFERDWAATGVDWDLIPSFTLRYLKVNTVVNPTATNELWELRGCVVTGYRTSYESGADGGIRVTLDFAFKRDYRLEEGTVNYIPPTGDVMTFACLQAPAGEPIALTDRCEVSINNSVNLLPDCGTRFKGAYVMGIQNVEVNTQCRAIDPATYMNRLHGGSTGPDEGGPIPVATMRFHSSNQKTGTEERKFQIDMDDVWVTSLSQSFDPEQPIYDRPRLKVKKAKVVIINNKDKGEYISMPDGPTANAGPDQSVSVGDTVTFDGSGSVGSNGLTYIWTFEDETLQTLGGVSPTYEFTTIGTYTVTLVVKDAWKQTDTDTVTITVA